MSAECEALAGHKQTEVGVIPDDWGVKRLGELGSVVRGGSPRPAGDPRYFNGDFIPWLTVAALTNVPDHWLEISETESSLTREGSMHSRTLPAGTVIIANSGATLGVAKVLGITCSANDGIAALIGQRDGDKRFICFYINTQTTQLRDVVATGNGQPNLNTGLIKNVRVPFPPLVEQRAIADALGDMDALLDALDRQIAKQRDLKQAAMQQLLTGRTRLPGFTGEWRARRIGDLAAVDPENLSATIDPHYTFDYISLECVDHGRLLQIIPSTFATAPSRARRFLRKGDVLMSTVRPNLKAHLWFQGRARDAIGSTGFAVLRAIKDACEPAYLFAHLFADPLNRQINTLLAGSNYPAMNSRDVASLMVPCPPTVAEQTAITAVLSDMDAEITALEARRAKTRNLKQAMLQELLTGRTRLVPPTALTGNDATVQ